MINDKEIIFYKMCIELTEREEAGEDHGWIILPTDLSETNSFYGSFVTKSKYSSVCRSRLVCFQAAATLQCKLMHIYGQRDETTKVINSRGQCFTTKL